ncbi:YlbF family regulator [Bacillus sp. HMF5848]|uniref:YlbF family regulator n=1 Tax=Bacillus sp. HMF5848 TaxID=2495421 RepID=UPI000F77375B|nr:YlbF family regulator [Bacillus sp. HMF5848]RSK26295.1 YlbF family regulator [Bacillus sp. HMF5848]
MSVNLHDVAYELEKGIRESDEFKAVANAYESMQQDPESHQLFEQFRSIQVDLQQKQMAGQEVTEQEVQQIQGLAMQAQQNEKIAKLMEAEQRMNMIFTEVSRIMMKPLEDLYK